MKYQWKMAWDRWMWMTGVTLGWSAGRGAVTRFIPRVPPDTARRRLLRRQMETLAWMVEQAKRMGKEVR